MTQVATYLTENANYIREESAAAISTLSDAEWLAVLEGLEQLNSGATDPGIDCDVAITHETISDFDSARVTHWRERGSREELTCAGMPAVFYERLQLHKGAERRSMVVIDLGSRRVALH